MSEHAFSRELIEHYLDGVADTAEVKTLEECLALDPQIADAFAEIARFEMVLQVHFARKSQEADLAQLPLKETEVEKHKTGGQTRENGFEYPHTGLEPLITGSSSDASSPILSLPLPPVRYPLSTSTIINSPVFPYVFAAFVMCVGALGAWFYQVDVPGSIAQDGRRSTINVATVVNDRTAECIGRITGMADCRLREGSRLKAQGSRTRDIQSLSSNSQSPVSLGDKFVLSSGLLEITYDTGAKVILQGPTTYEVDSAAGGYLSIGKLTARLETKGSGVRGQGSEKVASGQPSVVSGQWSVASATNPKSHISKSQISNPQSPASEFAVRTPTATVTDLGTEFAVEVNREGLCDVHVYLGKVKLASNRKTAEGGKMEVALAAGESMHVEHAGNLTRHATSRPTDFVRQMPCPDTRTAYAKAVMADKPLFYWNFDEADGTALEQMRHLSHQKLYPMGHARRSLHSNIGSGLALGRAADFSKAGSFRSNLLDRGEMSGAWAVEFWAQFTGNLADHSTQGVMETGADSKYGRYNPAILFSSPHDGLENTFMMASGGYKAGENEGSTRGGPQIADHLWHYVLLIFYGNSGAGFGVADRVDVIVDGVPCTIARRGFSSGFNMEGLVRVGASRDDLEDSFEGRIDELAFYDLSGLSEKTIESRTAEMARRHFRAAKVQQRESDKLRN